ncbi:colicin Ia central receptor-binding domain-containing protein [Escherichia coli]|uniref:colicin Ia central receptor-binding domain-containing protein n=1 Tax=Escherichia coli TaxID=562 RepID=UPI003F50E6C3
MNDISSDDIFLLKQRLAEQEALIHALQEKLSNREREIDHLQAQLDKLRRMNFGSRSEKVSRRIAQMEADLNRLQKESDTLTGRVYDPAVQRPLRQTRTRKPFPESLPRDEKRLLPAAPCCPNCGGSLSYLGEDTADITRQEFRLLQAELREYGFRTEIAGYDALRLHTESRMLFADADSLRISPREARSLIEQAEKRQKDAQNADKKAADMLAEYERRKGILDTRLSELEKNGGAALAVLDAQQARLLGQQTRNDRAISEARNKLSSVTESLNTARNALTRAEQQLTQQKNTPDGKTIVSPEKFPGRSSTNHSIVVSGDPRFAGTIKITTSAVIDNRANLNYLLTHSGLDYKRNILNDRNPVVTEDVEGDKKIYNAEVAEWDKLRQRLLDARNKITSAESAVNSARNNLSARTNEQKHANDALNALLKEKENIRNQLAGINQKIAEEKRKQDELKATKDAINFTTEFLKSVSEKYGAKAEQ